MCWASFGLWSQVLDPGDTGRLDQNDPDYDANEARRPGPQQQRVTSRDTFGIFAFEVANPNEERPFSDSLLAGWQIFDPSRKVDFDYATLGILGSAAYPLRYQPRLRRGVDLGLNHFDLYQVTGSNLSFYRQERPYTQLNFVQGSNQQDFMLDAQFSRNFADGVNFVIDYRRNSQRGARDQYPNQNLRNTNLATGFWINHAGGKYDAFISYAANTYEQQQNGGLTSLPDRDGPFATPSSAMIYLSDAFLRQTHREWMLTQYLQFGGRVDSSGRNRRAYTLSHQFRANAVTNRLTAGSVATDTSFYLRFPHLLIDDRGQRNFIRHNSIENSFRISTFRRDKSGSQANVQRDVIELGLFHAYHRIRQEPRDSTVNNLILTGRLGFRPSDRFKVVADGQLNLLGQVGDYQLRAAGELDLRAAGKLEINFLSQLVTPSVLAEQYWLTQSQVYRNDFNKTLETRIEGAITLPVVDIRLGAAYNLITNYIYYDSLGIAQQTAAAQNILQLTAERDFQFKWLNLRNRILLQSTDADFIPLPTLLGEHSIYYSGKWFKVLNVNLGFDFRYTNGFRPYYFNPIIQQFHLQERQNTDFYLQSDLFFSMRVTRFRFFFKYFQFNQLWRKELQFLSAESPYPDGANRIGISWRMVD